MKISLVIHGPEVIDSGEAKRVLEKLSCIGKVEARLGGIMGKTAVLDARLENVIDISRHLRACLKIKLNPTIGIGLIHLNRKTLALNR
jgi:hypothetical protein